MQIKEKANKKLYCQQTLGDGVPRLHFRQSPDCISVIGRPVEIRNDTKPFPLPTDSAFLWRYLFTLEIIHWTAVEDNF